MILGKKRRTDEDSQQRLRDLIVSYKRVFGTTEGKEVLFDLMNRFHMLNPTGGDPLKEGQRTVVLHIVAQNGINLEQLDRMMKGDMNDSVDG